MCKQWCGLVLFETAMSTIKLPVTPLPPKPVPYEEWQLAWPDCRSAYDRVYNAEWHALQQVEANATSKETKQKLISARVAGYLLVELFNRRTILSEGPCASLVKKLISSPRVPGGTDHDLVFDIGKWNRDYFLRLCTFDSFPMSFGISVSLQFGHLPGSTHYPPHTLRVPPSTPWRT
jgi:hypothetical protein